MAERNRAGESGSPLCCEVAWVRRRRALEDMPMARIDARAGEETRCRPDPCRHEDEDDCDHGHDCDCDCGCCGITGLLEAQNKLLCDILGAVNCLTAALLAAANQKAQ